jgi:hypothetical protein
LGWLDDVASQRQPLTRSSDAGTNRFAKVGLGGEAAQLANGKEGIIELYDADCAVRRDDGDPNDHESETCPPRVGRRVESPMSFRRCRLRVHFRPFCRLPRCVPAGAG